MIEEDMISSMGRSMHGRTCYPIELKTVPIVSAAFSFFTATAELALKSLW